MAWVTNDKKVVPIIRRMQVGTLTETEARELLRLIPPEPGKGFYLLDWEIDEAIKEGRKKITA